MTGASKPSNPVAVPVHRLGLNDDLVTVLWAVSRVQELQARPTPARVRDEPGASFDAIVWASDLPSSYVRKALEALAGHALVVAGRQEPGQSWRSYFVHARGRSLLARSSVRGLELPRTRPPASVSTGGAVRDAGPTAAPSTPTTPAGGARRGPAEKHPPRPAGPEVLRRRPSGSPGGLSQPGRYEPEEG